MANTSAGAADDDGKRTAWKRSDAADLNEAAIGPVDQVQTIGRHFVDGYGRILQLRGFNVSGASKLPSQPDGLSALTDEDFFQHQTVSFVGRPFPLAEAPFHFARLRAWGHTLIRLLVTWESLSHAGPDPNADLDLEYVDYLDRLITLMPQYGLKVVICAHQDVWSRFSGGSGAPAWTFAKAGLDVEAFRATGAAYIAALSHQSSANGQASAAASSSKKEPVGAFVWPSGYQKLAAATMATLFWGGEYFAWNLRLPSQDPNKKESVNIQEYLQEAYIETFGVVMDRLGGHEAVLGFDLMNEPHRGYIGQDDWNKWCYETDLHIGHFPSLLQSLALGSGHKQDVPFYVKSWPFPTRKTHMSTIDPLGKSAWLQTGEGMGECVWSAHGAWQWDERKREPVILSEDFFIRDPRPGKLKEPIEWYRDCYAPFVRRFSQRLRLKHKRLLCFVEPIPNEFFPPWSSEETRRQLSEEDREILAQASVEQSYATKTFIETARPDNFVYAPHFYDLNVLFSKGHGTMSVDVQSLSRGGFILNALFFGVDGLKKNYKRQIAKLIENGQTSLGAVPTIIGEVGIPFDINNRQGLYTGDYGKQIELLDALIEAMEQSQVGFTLWNYNPDNRVDVGDGWNLEDFSVVCNEKYALDIDNVFHDGTADDHTEKDTQQLPAVHKGGRALPAILRPYAAKVAGFPLRTLWDREQTRFEFEYANAPAEFVGKASAGVAKDGDFEDLSCTTKVFLPRFYFEGVDVRVDISDGEFHLDVEGQTLSVKHANRQPGFTHRIRVSATAHKDESVLTPAQQALQQRRQHVRKRRSKRFNGLSASDGMAIGGVLVGVLATLSLSQVAARHLFST